MKMLSFELPLYRPPSGHLRQFVADIKNNVIKPTNLQFCTENNHYKVLRFEARIGENFLCAGMQKRRRIHLASVCKPFPKGDDISEECAEKISQGASVFASKFNAMLSVTNREKCDIQMDLISYKSMTESERTKARQMYGDSVDTVMRVMIVTETLASNIVLANFFELLDS